MKNCEKCAHYYSCVVPYKINKLFNNHAEMFNPNPLDYGVLNIYAESCKKYEIRPSLNESF